MDTAEVVVVGLGAVGSASLYQLAKRGARVIGIDRFAPPHTHGSTHGESRITRQAIGEGEAYVPFVLRSHEIWRELEAATGEALMLTCGGLILSSHLDEPPHPSKASFLERTIRAARRYDIPHEILEAPELTRRFPQLGLRGGERGYYEPGAGVVHPEACVRTQLEQARHRGADIHTDETVLEIEPLRDGVRLRTTRGEYRAGRVVVSVGAWAAQLLGEALRRLLRVQRRVLYWFEPEGAERARAYSPEHFPVFIWSHGPRDHDYFYGFPQLAAGVKVAAAAIADPTSPEDVNREVSVAEGEAMYREHVRGRLLGVSPRLLRAATCLYTSTSDHDFILDHHPDCDRILIASPCSGHGFKHSAAIGEAMAQRVLDEHMRFDLRAFALDRFSRASASF
ncbi:N-methyl-L-tryptophan oxidase [Deinococcus planocerae]|uniref:N-methyl-L-tryptophan oxidase n=1 Tax=Deinococcus planocerae TaxID=1737569 RepID=UPI000C7EF2B5|nr:N-methyl-L-tryptophan oxidase [Deinococcus planocerae]